MRQPGALASAIVVVLLSGVLSATGIIEVGSVLSSLPVHDLSILGQLLPTSTSAGLLGSSGGGLLDEVLGSVTGLLSGLGLSPAGLPIVTGLLGSIGSADLRVVGDLVAALPVGQLPVLGDGLSGVPATGLPAVSQLLGSVPAGQLALVGGLLGPLAGSGTGLSIVGNVLSGSGGLPLGSLPCIGNLLAGLPLGSLPGVARLLTI
jgi:hypothetical protein